MSTSANVIEYRIEKGGQQVGSHRINIMCETYYEKLLIFHPLSEHTITPWGYDEEEEYWEDEPIELEEFLRKLIPTNKIIKEYFNGNKDILNILNNILDDIKKQYPIGTEFKCVLKGYDCVVNGTPYIDNNGNVRVGCINGKRGVIKKLL